MRLHDLQGHYVGLQSHVCILSISSHTKVNGDLSKTWDLNPVGNYLFFWRFVDSKGVREYYPPTIFEAIEDIRIAIWVFVTGLRKISEYATLGTLGNHI